jgi:hypothetical protein
MSLRSLHSSPWASNPKSLTLRHQLFLRILIQVFFRSSTSSEAVLDFSTEATNRGYAIYYIVYVEYIVGVAATHSRRDARCSLQDSTLCVMRYSVVANENPFVNFDCISFVGQRSQSVGSKGHPAK